METSTPETPRRALRRSGSAASGGPRRVLARSSRRSPPGARAAPRPRRRRPASRPRPARSSRSSPAAPARGLLPRSSRRRRPCRRRRRNEACFHGLAVERGDDGASAVEIASRATGSILEVFEARDDRAAEDLREADHGDDVVLARPRGCRAGRGSSPSRRCGGSPGCRARSRAATARRASSPRPCRSRPRRRARAALKRTPQSTCTTMPFLYLPDLSPRRMVADLRPLRSWSATIGE